MTSTGGIGILSLLLSVLVHGLIAVGLVHCMGRASTPDKPVQLDVTRVEVSFSETPDETAAVAPASAPQTQAPPLESPEPKMAPPPLSDSTGLAIPRDPQPDTTDLPKPDEPLERFEEKAAPRQARIDAPPKPRGSIKPDYPKESRQSGEQGRVTLEISVNGTGGVDDVRIFESSGHPLLDEAAVKAARSARFTPAQSGGRPIASTVRLPLEFRLR